MQIQEQKEVVEESVSQPVATSPEVRRVKGERSQEEVSFPQPVQVPSQCRFPFHSNNFE